MFDCRIGTGWIVIGNPRRRLKGGVGCGIDGWTGRPGTIADVGCSCFKTLDWDTNCFPSNPFVADKFAGSRPQDCYLARCRLFGHDIAISINAGALSKGEGGFGNVGVGEEK